MGCQVSNAAINRASIGVATLGLLGLPLAYFGLKNRGRLAGLTVSLLVASGGVVCRAVSGRFYTSDGRGAPLSSPAQVITPTIQPRVERKESLPEEGPKKEEAPPEAEPIVVASITPPTRAEPIVVVASITSPPEAEPIAELQPVASVIPVTAEEPPLVQVSYFRNGELNEFHSLEVSKLISSLCPGGRPWKDPFGYGSPRTVYLSSGGEVLARNDGLQPEGTIRYSHDHNCLIYRQYIYREWGATMKPKFEGWDEYSKVIYPTHMVTLSRDGRQMTLAKDDERESALGDSTAIEYGEVRLEIRMPQIDTPTQG